MALMNAPMMPQAMMSQAMNVLHGQHTRVVVTETKAHTMTKDAATQQRSHNSRRSFRGIWTKTILPWL